MVAIEVNSSADQKVTLSASSAQSAAIDGTAVRVTSDVDCWLAFGANPTATNANLYLPAKSPDVFFIPDGWKVAAIAAGAGNLYISVVSLD